MKKGDIVLIPFPFTDLTGNKNRPALVLACNDMDVTVAFISTQTKWKVDTDIILFPSKESGIKKESLVRLSKLATIDRDLVIGRLGTIKDKTIRLVNQKPQKNLKAR